MYTLTQLADVPTCITENISTAIDHIYFTIPDNICEVLTMALRDQYHVCLTHTLNANNSSYTGKRTTIIKDHINISMNHSFSMIYLARVLMTFYNMITV